MTRQPVSKESVSEGATRLLRAWGAAYDWLGNGKVKLYGSFGYFYDMMKYQLPRGSFGATTGMTACMRWTHQTSHKSSRSVIPRPLLPSWMCDSLHHLGQSRYLVVERLELSVHARIATGWPPYLLPHPADHLGATLNYIRDLSRSVFAV